MAWDVSRVISRQLGSSRRRVWSHQESGVEAGLVFICCEMARGTGRRFQSGRASFRILALNLLRCLAESGRICRGVRLFVSARLPSRMNRRLFLSGVLAFGLTVLPAWAADKRLLNLNDQGVAIQGYAPVAFFTVKAPVKGKMEFTSEFNGARYWFHSVKSKSQFDSEPARYEPQFGGYCAYGVSRAALAPIQIEAWQIVDGRLLMQKNPGIRDDFNEDAAGNLKKAGNWPKLIEKKGR